LFGIEKEKIRVIPNGVDPNLFVSLPDKPRFNIKPDDKIVFFIGRLVPEKGVAQLISAFPQVLEKIPEAKLYIGGRGPQKPELEKLAKELGINDKVYFTGFIRELERNFVYHHAKVAVFPSFYEPF